MGLSLSSKDNCRKSYDSLSLSYKLPVQVYQSVSPCVQNSLPFLLKKKKIQVFFFMGTIEASTKYSAEIYSILPFSKYLLHNKV